jgi:hypothetical protein
VTVWRFGLILSTFLGLISPASAQVLLYAQHLPANTVYMRLVNALPGPASIQTDFAGKVTLGADGPARVSPYFVSTTAGGKTVDLQVDEGGKTVTSTFQPKSGAFITVVLHREGDKIIASIITDKPEYNQLRARLAFYNATRDCPGGVLTQASGPSIFSNIAPDGAAARGINPVAAKVVAGCTAGKTPPLDLGQLDAGGLYTVWMMRPEGNLVAFVARDTIAPPRS